MSHSAPDKDIPFDNRVYFTFSFSFLVSSSVILYLQDLWQGMFWKMFNFQVPGQKGKAEIPQKTFSGRQINAHSPWHYRPITVTSAALTMLGISTYLLLMLRSVVGCLTYLTVGAWQKIGMFYSALRKMSD